MGITCETYENINCLTVNDKLEDAEIGKRFVMNLIINDGVPSRMDRTNIFRPEIESASIGIS